MACPYYHNFRFLDKIAKIVIIDIEKIKSPLDLILKRGLNDEKN